MDVFAEVKIAVWIIGYFEVETFGILSSLHQIHKN